MNDNVQHLDQRVADLVAEFVDLQSKSPAPTLDGFLVMHADVANVLRPLLETAIKMLGSSVQFVPSKDSSESFLEIRKAYLESQRQTALRRDIDTERCALPVDKRPDFLILLLAHVKRGLGITRLQKLMFLLGKEGNATQYVSDYYSHIAYNYGPFEKSLYQDLNALIQYGLVEEYTPRKKTRKADKEIGEAVNSSSVDAFYRLSSKGGQFAAALERGADLRDPRICLNMAEVVKKYARVPYRELIRDVYTRYPEFAKESKIRSEILGGKQ